MWTRSYFLSHDDSTLPLRVWGHAHMFPRQAAGKLMLETHAGSGSGGRSPIRRKQEGTYAGPPVMLRNSCDRAPFGDFKRGRAGPQ